MYDKKGGNKNLNMLVRNKGEKQPCTCGLSSASWGQKEKKVMSGWTY
jgi:hypothetical protein